MVAEPRPNHRSRHGKPTAEELPVRVLFCRQLLSQGLYDGQVKEQAARKFRISQRTVERYLRRARDEMVAEAGKDRGELRAEGYGFYREVRGDKKATAKDRLKAQERIDKLLGLEAPQKVQVSSAELDRLIEAELERVGRRKQTGVPEPAAADRNGHAGAAGT